MRHTILVVFQQIPNNLICQNDSPHVIYALDAVSVYFAYIYVDKVKRCVHLRDKSMFFPLCISLKINIFKELLKSNALTNFQEIWTDKFKIFRAFLGGRGGVLYIFLKKSNLPFLWLFDTCINNPLYDFFSSYIAKEIYI